MTKRAAPQKTKKLSVKKLDVKDLDVKGQKDESVRGGNVPVSKYSAWMTV